MRAGQRAARRTQASSSPVTGTIASADTTALRWGGGYDHCYICNDAIDLKLERDIGPVRVMS